MNDSDIREVCSLIAGSRRPGGVVSVIIRGSGEEGQIVVNSAPGCVMEAIADAGYRIAVEFGSVVVTCGRGGERDGEA